MDIRSYTLLNQSKTAVRVIAILLFFLFLYIVYSAERTYYSIPVDGFGGSTVDEGFEIEEVFFEDLAETIKPGDIITQVGDIKIGWDQPNFTDTLEELYLGFSRNKDIPYIIKTERGEEEYKINLRTIPAETVYKGKWIGIIVILAYLLIGLVVVFVKPFEKKAWLFYIFCCIGSLAIFDTDFFMISALPELSAAVWDIKTLWVLPLALIAFLHFSIEFPSNQYPSSWNRLFTLLFLIVGIGTLIGVNIVDRAMTVENVKFAVLTSGVLTYGYTALLGILGMGFLISSYIKTRSKLIEHAQMKWVLWGFAIPIVLGLLIYQLGWAILRREIISFEILGAMSLSIPISIAIAINKYKLFAIESIINKSVIYAAVTVVVGFIYALLSLLISVIIRGRFQIAIPSLEVTTGFIITVILLRPLYSFVQANIDRFFFREKINRQQLIERVSKALAVSTKYEDLAKLILDEVSQRLAVSHAWLYVINPDSHDLIDITTRKEAAGQFEKDIWAFLVSQDTVSKLQIVDADALLTEFPMLKKNKVALLIPLNYAGKLVGLYVVGEKEGGGGYSIAEIEALDVISAQLAVAVKNAQAFDEIEQEKQSVERILESISEGVMVIDADGKIARANDAVVTMIGNEYQAFLNTHYTNVFSLYENKECTVEKNIIQTMFTDPESFHGNAYLKSVQKNIAIPISLFVKPLFDQENKLVGLIVTIYDRSEEEELLSSKDSFISTVAHELRTPMVILKGLTDEILDTKLTKEGRTFSESLKAKLLSLGDRIEQVLDITRVRAESVSANNIIDITELLQVIGTSYQLLARNKGLEFSQTIPHSPIKTIFTQIDFEKIVRTLLDNAIAFTEKGTISLNVQTSSHKDSVQSMDEREAQYAIVSVSDTGRGIDQKTLKNLFEPFVQQGGALARDQIHGGLGLGLYLAKLVVEKYGGEIWVDSVIDAGTTVYFSVPLLKESTT